MDKDHINILVVDDEEQFLNSITKTLEVRNFAVFAANRGEKALEISQTVEIDIALLDLKMPGMDGEEVLKRLKKQNKWMEVVILTGHGTIDSAAQCTRDGAFSYLQKPCNMDQLIETLMNAYKRRVMNKQKIQEKKMDEMLQISLTLSPREILKKLKEIDRKGYKNDFNT